MKDPIMHLVVLETPEGEHSVECSQKEFVWNAAARQGIRLPAICHQGRCLTCAAKLISGVVDQRASVSYFPEDLKAKFVLPCTCRPCSDLRLHTHQAGLMRAFRLSVGLPAPYA
jgi:ferredoxin